MQVLAQATVTPLPLWVCQCHESLWREFHDPQYLPTTVNMVVSLPYSTLDFTKVMQDKFRSTVATAAEVELFRVTINSIQELEPTGLRRLLADSVHVDFSVRVPAATPGNDDIYIYTHRLTDKKFFPTHANICSVCICQGKEIRIRELAIKDVHIGVHMNVAVDLPRLKHGSIDGGITRHIHRKYSIPTQMSFGHI